MDSTTTTTFTTTSIPSTSTSHLHHPLLDPAQCTVVEFSSKKDPKFFEKKMAAEVIKYFKSHEFRGPMQGHGNSSKLPLLSRLAGGFAAWESESGNNPSGKDADTSSSRRMSK